MVAILVSTKILPVSASNDKERTCLHREIGPTKPVRDVRSGQVVFLCTSSLLGKQIDRGKIEPSGAGHTHCSADQCAVRDVRRCQV